MAEPVFTSGPFRGVPTTDAFAVAALKEAPVVVDLGAINWPKGLKPEATAFGAYHAGQKITDAVEADIDVLVVLYTDQETSALLGVFTGNNAWSPARRVQWCGYGHNFAQFKSSITGISGDTGLEEGLFGYFSAVRIGNKTVALYKSELHPKQNGPKLPFIPVLQQLITELKPSLVITTGTAGAIGSSINCGDVVINSSARFHIRDHYPDFPALQTMSENETEIGNTVAINTQYIEYAAAHLTKLSLPGLSECYTELQRLQGYGFVKKNSNPNSIYVTGKNPVAGQQMVTVSADYLTVDDIHNTEGLQPLGNMNDTDDAFLFYAVDNITTARPKIISIRNASEPEISGPSFPPGTPTGVIIDKLKGIAGSIYGIYQYCTTLNSAFACWGVIAGL
jgi:hypothetical protein